MPTTASLAASMRSASEAQEKVAENVPLAAEYLEVRDKVFALADSLGIGNEVRQIYHDTAFGVQAGSAAGAGVATLLGGGLAATYSGAVATGAAFGMAAGGLVGAAIGILSSIFGGDDDEEEAKRDKKRAEQKAAYEASVKEYARYLLSPVSLDSLIQENQRYIRPGPGITSGPLFTAQQLAKLYTELKPRLNRTQQAIFALGVERGRVEFGLTKTMFSGPLYRNTYARDVHNQLVVKREAVNRKIAQLGRMLSATRGGMGTRGVSKKEDNTIQWAIGLTLALLGYKLFF